MHLQELKRKSINDLTEMAEALNIEGATRLSDRDGAGAIMLSRFSHGVRLFASALSGCGHIPYWKFIAFDAAGTILYAALWVAVGHLVGERAAEFLGRHGATRLLLLIGPLALATLIGYRLWRRRRYGPARSDVLREQSSCVRGPR